MLLDRAEKAGAAIEKTRVLGIERRDNGWHLRTQAAASREADFCIVATGARNPLREVGTEWGAKDTMTALGYYVPAVAGSHRHSISAAASKATSGCSRAAAIFRWASAERASRRRRCGRGWKHT